MMRIMHVANFNTYKFGNAYYSVGRKLSNGLVRNGNYVYDFSHRDDARAANIFRAKSMGIRQMNRHLLELADNLRPELLLFGHSELVHVDTLKAIKDSLGIPIAMWYVDQVYSDEKLQYIYDRLPLLDAFFCTTGGQWLEKFSETRAQFFPNPVDASVETGRNFEKVDFKYDVAFCGSDKHDPFRRAFIGGVKDKLDDLDIKVCGSLGNPTLYGDLYMQVLRDAKMGINFSRRNDVDLYASDRIAHLMGNGLLTFSPRVPGMDILFRDDEIVYFDDADDLIAKIRHYHADDIARKQIAENGWNRSQTACSSTRIAKYMLEVISGADLSEDYQWLASHCED